MRERTEMSRGRGGRFARGRSEVQAPRSSSEIFTLRGPEGVSMPPSCPIAGSCPGRRASGGRERDRPGSYVGGLEAHGDRPAGRRAAVLEASANGRLAKLDETLVDHDRVEPLALAAPQGGGLDEGHDPPPPPPRAGGARAPRPGAI